MFELPADHLCALANPGPFATTLRAAVDKMIADQVDSDGDVSDGAADDATPKDEPEDADENDRPVLSHVGADNIEVRHPLVHKFLKAMARRNVEAADLCRETAWDTKRNREEGQLLAGCLDAALAGDYAQVVEILVRRFIGLQLVLSLIHI